MKLKMKHFILRHDCLVGKISLQTVKCIERRSLILLYKQCLTECLIIRLSVFFEISIFVTTNNLIKQTNSFCKYSFNGKNKAIDESMLLYYGTHTIRQRINNTSRFEWDIKFGSLQKHGCVVELFVVQDVKKGKLFASFTK